MPRISGVDIPPKKQVLYSLTYIYGIGITTARRILKAAGIAPTKKADDLTDEEVGKIGSVIDESFPTEGQLRREITQNINRLKRIGCYRGVRHGKGLPVHGQRTRTNARTRKGRAVPIAGKKGVKGH